MYEGNACGVPSRASNMMDECGHIAGAYSIMITQSCPTPVTCNQSSVHCHYEDLHQAAALLSSHGLPGSFQTMVLVFVETPMKKYLVANCGQRRSFKHCYYAERSK